MSYNARLITGFAVVALLGAVAYAKNDEAKTEKACPMHQQAMAMGCHAHNHDAAAATHEHGMKHEGAAAEHKCKMDGEAKDASHCKHGEKTAHAGGCCKA